MSLLTLLKCGFNSPSDVPNLALWLDPTSGLYQETTGASATTACANNDPIGTWRARTGQYYTAASSSTRPTYKTSVINSTPGTGYDFSDDALVAASPPSVTGAFTHYGVFNDNDINAHIVMLGGDPTGNNFSIIIFLGLDGGGGLYFTTAGDDSSIAVAPSASTGNNAFRFRRDVSNNCFLKMNSNSEVSVGSKSGTFNPSVIGARTYTGGSGAFYTSASQYIGTQILYSAALSTPQDTFVRGYLNARFGTSL